uniref:Nodule Cysteine-Rich (NCR) secreted peptide n=1 Tax=Medicago truncatula TaxID=3880 RepID=I3S0U2_MEDTR|nr:unknown [Medicago truncatula]
MFITYKWGRIWLKGDIPNNSNRNSPKEDVFCNSNDDCPTILYYVSKCVYNFCEYW